MLTFSYIVLVTSLQRIQIVPKKSDNIIKFAMQVVYIERTRNN